MEMKLRTRIRLERHAKSAVVVVVVVVVVRRPVSRGVRESRSSATKSFIGPIDDTATKKCVQLKKSNPMK